MQIFQLQISIIVFIFVEFCYNIVILAFILLGYFLSFFRKGITVRELAVYYCLKCGRYGYYQSSKNATCPICNEPMKLLDMTYQDFMNLDCEERDHLFSHLILESCPTYVQQLMAPHQAANHRETIARMRRLLKKSQIL